MELPHRRPSGLREMAQGPQRPHPHEGRPRPLPQDRHHPQRNHPPDGRDRPGDRPTRRLAGGVCHHRIRIRIRRQPLDDKDPFARPRSSNRRRAAPRIDFCEHLPQSQPARPASLSRIALPHSALIRTHAVRNHGHESTRIQQEIIPRRRAAAESLQGDPPCDLFFIRVYSWFK